METKNIGLRNIPIADTKISLIDGEKGKLIYRGFDVLDLTKNSNFEECCFLLLHDHLPNKIEFDEFTRKLKEARTIPEQMQKNMRNWRKNAQPISPSIPANAYITESISGERGTPCIISSSPVLIMMLKSIFFEL